MSICTAGSTFPASTCGTATKNGCEGDYSVVGKERKSNVSFSKFGQVKTYIER